jgi:hypothetical protein
MMKKYILAAATAAMFAAPNSHASNTAEYCTAFANLAESTAIARDRGTPAARLQAIAAQEHPPNAESRALVIYLIDMVYHDKNIKQLPPERVRSVALIACLRNRM